MYQKCVYRMVEYNCFETKSFSMCDLNWLYDYNYGPWAKIKYQSCILTTSGHYVPEFILSPLMQQWANGIVRINKVTVHQVELGLWWVPLCECLTLVLKQTSLSTTQFTDKTFRWQLDRWMYLSMLLQSCHRVGETSSHNTRWQHQVKRPVYLSMALWLC